MEEALVALVREEADAIREPIVVADAPLGVIHLEQGRLVAGALPHA